MTLSSIQHENLFVYINKLIFACKDHSFSYSDFFNLGIFGSVVAFEGQGKDGFIFVGVPCDEEEEEVVDMLLLNFFSSEILVDMADDLFKSIE